MPDITTLFAASNKNEGRPTNTQDTVPTMKDRRDKKLDDYQAGNMNINDAPAPQTFNSEQDKRNFIANQVSNTQAPVSNRLQRGELGGENEEALSAEQSQKDIPAEAATSFMRGIGSYTIGGFGDIAQVLGGFTGLSDMYEGNMFSRNLQQWGESMADNNKVALPEELKDPSFSISTMINPRFWSTHIAESIPQLIEFILLSKGAGSLIKQGVQKGAKSALKGGLIKNAKTTLKNKSKKLVKKIDETYEVSGTGKGLGKLVTDAGELTKATGAVVETVGAGMTSNVLSGMLNAAEAYNTRKEMVDLNGQPLFSKEELGDIAASTFNKNLEWMAIDILSWGMTYGKGSQILKNSNIYRKGSQAFNKSKSLKNISKGFSAEQSGLMGKLVRVAGKGAVEGMEETFQETFESWAAIRAEEDVKGKKSKYKNYWEYYQSEENESTKAIAFALGALGGSVSSAISGVNKSAERARQMYDRTENLKTIFDAGDQEGKEWQQFHIRETMSDIVLNKKEDSFNGFIKDMLQKGVITEDEYTQNLEMFQDYSVLNEQANNLNVRGKYALFQNHSQEQFFAEHIADKQDELAANMEIINAMPIDEGVRNKKIKQMQKESDAEIDILIAAMSESTANKNSLLLGETIESTVNVQFAADDNGKTQVVVGLNNEDYDYYVNDKDEDILKENDKKSFFKKLTEGAIGKKAKKLYKETKNTIEDGIENVKEQVTGKPVDEDPGATESDTESPADKSELSSIDEKDIAQSDNVAREQGKNEDTLKKSSTANRVSPITDEEISELGTLDNELSSLKSVKKKFTEDREVLKNIPKETSLTEKKRHENDVDVASITKSIDAIDVLIKEKTPRFEELTTKAKTESEVTGEGVDSKQSNDALKKANVSDNTIHPNTVKELAQKVADKVKLTPKQKALVEKYTDVIGEAVNKLGGSTKRFQEFVNSQEAQNFAEEAKIKTKTVLNKLTVAIKRLRRSGATDSDVSDIFDTSGSVTDPIAEAKDVADIKNEIDAPVPSSNIGRIKYGPTNLDKMVAINERLLEVFPNVNKRVTAYILNDLTGAIGIQGVGYAVGSSVFIQADKWDQGEVFMHEISHIYYKFGKDLPQTRQVLEKVMKNNALIDDIKKKYPDYILYDLGTDFEGRTRTGVTDDSKGLTELPLQQQTHILEEAFVAMLQGPLSKKYNNFFAPREEFSRIKSVSKWWTLFNKNATKDPQHLLEVNDLIKKLNDGKELNIDNMRDFMVNKFNEFVEPISDNELGYEARVNNYKAVEAVKKADIIKQLSKEQEVFEKSVFEGAVPETEITELLTEELTEIQGEDNPILGIMDRTFKSRTSKATKILTSFVKQYNKAIRLRKLFGVKGQALFDREEFMYKMLDLAKYSPDSPSFINAINNSPLVDVQAFNKFLDLKAQGQKTVLLDSIWFVMSNYRMVSAVNTALVDTENGEVEHRIEEATSNKEKTAVQNMMNNLVVAKRHATSNNGHLLGEQWNDFNAIIGKIKNNDATAEDYINAYKFMSGPSIKIMDILDYGYINVFGTNYSPITTLKAFFQNDRHLDTEGRFKGQINPYKFAPLLNAISVTNRSFTQDSIVANAVGNMVPVRITNNHMTKEIDNMFDSLKPNSEGRVMTKGNFIKRYSHVTSGKKYRKPVPNQFLEGFYDTVVKTGAIPDIVYYTGINDLTSGKANTYDSSTAYEQSFEDLMMYLRNPNKGTYLSNIGTFGDSPRKFYTPTKRVKKNNDTTSAIYNIYRNIVENPLSISAFNVSITKAVSNERALINSNGKQFSKVKSMKKYFTNNKLNEQGRKMVDGYVYNTIANGMFMAEVFSPNIKYKDIAKRLKNSSSPVMSVNKQLKFEPIFFQDPLLEGVEATDGGMYILEEDANRWRNAGLGVFDLKFGFKFLNYSIEKNNPKFKGQTVLLKGYTTILNDAEIVNNPKLKGLYDLLKERSKKYTEFHKGRYGAQPSSNFTDGLPNSFPIAIPLSSEKGDVYNKVNKKDAPTLDGLNDSTKEANTYFDGLMYDDNEFLGLSGYNFGPQQVMDNQTTEVTLPVQQVNSIIVQAANLGHLEESEAIQKLLSDSMESNLDKILTQLKSEDIGAYTNLIKGSMDKDAMDQVQRQVIEKFGIMHPRAHQIVVNQLANSLKVAGNKLKVPGTYAHQKSDIGYVLPKNTEVNGSKTLNGYMPNGNGLRKAEIVLPKHLSKSVRSREYVTEDTELGLTALNILDDSKGKGVGTTSSEDLGAMKIFTEGRAKRLGVGTGEVKRGGKVIGYYVEGETVIATRVPSNGPSFTGIFEAVGFQVGEGNQVQVPTSFTKIVGADLDGDALFIQHKGKDKKVNEAIDRIAKLWLSPKMKPFILTEMNTKEEGNRLKEIVAKSFPTASSDNPIPFSPQARRVNYEDSMVAKRNIGTVFNLHRVSNTLAAYKATINKKISVDGEGPYDVFKDEGVGQDSRNHKSALVANLILDNLNEQAADALNLNEHTVSAFTLLVNLNVPIEKVAIMMNAPMVKEYVKILNENNSAFHGYVRRGDLLKELKNYSSNQKTNGIDVIADATDPRFFSKENQSKVINLIMAMEEVNSEVQSISKIMAGHKGIETNPYLLQKQINSFKEVMNGNIQGGVLNIPESMTSNPDIKRYLKTAEAVLEHTKKLDPVYRPAMTKLLNQLGESINNGLLSDNQIKKYTGTIMQFLNSKALGTNYTSKEHFKNLVKPGTKENIFTRMNVHIAQLKADNKLDKNLLLTQGLNMKFSGKKPYISLNTQFFDESLSSGEMNRMRMEFEQLPLDLQHDLFDYDLLKNKWDSPFSLLSIMGHGLNDAVTYHQKVDFKEKGNTEYSRKTIAELERIIVSKDNNGKRNNFIKMNLVGKSPADFKLMLQKNPLTRSGLLENKPFYFQAKREPGKRYRLYRYSPMTAIEHNKVFADPEDQLQYLATKAVKRLVEVKSDTNDNLDIDALTIRDGKDNRPAPKKKDPSIGKEAREEYWEYDSKDSMPRSKFDAAMEFTKYDNLKRQESLYATYVKDKEEANEIFESKFKNKSFIDMSGEHLLKLYNQYGDKNAYAYSIITTPIVKALANKVSVQQSTITGKAQGTTDISAVKAFMVANNIPSDHPAVQGLVRTMEAHHKKFSAEKSKYVKKINEITDKLYQEKFGFMVGSSRIEDFIKRLYYTFFYDRGNLYSRLYGNLVETNVINMTDGKKIQEFKLKSPAEIKNSNLTEAELDFYKTFTGITKELSPYSASKNGLRTDYVPHVSMGLFESFSNRGMLGMLQNSKPDNELIYDVKLQVANPDTGEIKLISFKDIENGYRQISKQTGNNLETIKEYIKLRRKALKFMKEGVNEDGTALVHNPMGIDTALSFGAMSRFTNNRSVRATEFPSMDLNHALSSYVHSTLFVNGNKNFSGFKALQGVIDGILAFNQERGFKNINKYVKINWKDAYLKGKKQELLGKTGDKVVDLITKMNLFWQLGFKASYVLGNVAAGKYHNIKNGSPKEWLTGEKRFWGADKSVNPLEVVQRFKRAQKIMKNINFMDINVYDNVSFSSKSRLDNFFGDLALMPMTWSENWIQRVQMAGMLTEEEWGRFDDNGEYKIGEMEIPVERITMLENEVKKSQGKGYQVTDQRIVQQYSLGRLFMQFSRFIPTMFHDRFAKQDIDIYGKENIGALRAVYEMVSKVHSMNPKDYMAYRKSLSPDMRKRLDSGLKGLAMSGLIGAYALETGNRFAESTYLDANYYMNFDKLAFKLKPSAVRSTQNLIDSIL